MLNLTLRQLRVFEAVARHMSFTRAAQELHLSQPAVSMQVKQLEDCVGLELFEKLGKRIFLTAAGFEMLHCAQAVLFKLIEAEQVFAEMKGIEGGRLNIAVATTVNYFATRILAEFNRHFPNVGISLEVTNREGLLERLAHNETDIVLMGQPPENIDIESTAFMDNPLVIIAAPGHPLANAERVELEQLKNETFLMREPGSGTRSALERLCASQGISLIGSGMEMNSNEAIKQGVQAGLGLGVVSIHTVEAELERGQLQLINAEHFPIQRQWFVVNRRGKRLSVTAKAFKDFVISESANL
jgi:DNA-binding transcriptional LysR family regulator